MENKKYSFLSKNIFLFALSGIIPKLLAFILVPIYTSKLSTYDYGVFDLLTTTVYLLVPIFTLTIRDAVMRYVFDDTIEKKHVFSTFWWIINIGTTLIIAGIILLVILGFINIQLTYLYFLVIFFWANSISEAITRFCRGIDKVNTIVIGSIINSLVMFSANIILLVIFNLGIYGYLIANVSGYLISIVYMFFSAKLYKYVTLKVPHNIINKMVRFSFPMIFSALAWWINSGADRYLLSWFAGVSVSGIYAISGKIPSILAMFQNIFQQAWSISAIKNFDRNDTDGFIGNIFKLINFTMAIACSAIIILNIPITQILVEGDFFESWKYVPLLLISTFFNAIALYFDSIFLAVKDTKLISTATIIGAITNIILNVILIPHFAAYGAAFATFFGYCVALTYRIMRIKKYILINVNWKREIFTWFLLIIQTALAIWGLKFTIIQCIILITLLLSYKKEVKTVWNMGLNKIKNRGETK